MTALGPGAEFDRLRGIFRRLATADVMGDDCALVTVGGVPLALSCDLSVEGRHFRTEWLTPTEIGWRAASAALSDLAAVAAEPAGVLAGVAMPTDLPTVFLEDLMQGIEAAATAVGASVWGGDLSASEQLAIDVTVIGQAARPVRRTGARPGDQVCVTGMFGGPAVALTAWQSGTEPPVEARERFAHPEPRIREAAWLRDHGATAMIDVSDGLSGDAEHLAAASGVALRLDVEVVPRHPAAASWEDAVRSGEEYELLVTLPPDVDDWPDWLSRIGIVEAGSGVMWTRGGLPVTVGGGYSHF